MKGLLDLKIIFLGTPDFAVQSLDALCSNGYEIVGVVTMPDKKSGRGRKLTPSAVKQYALDKGINVLQPTNLKEDSFVEELRELDADLQVVVAFRMLPEVVWNMPPLGTINVHASLLPNYRGAAPINWAIINGEHETGITTFQLKHKIDTGNILMQERIPIAPDDDAGTLHDKLMKLGATTLLQTVKAIADQSIVPKPQKFVSEENLKQAPKLFKSNCYIHWNQPTSKVKDFIRGLSPYPAAISTFILSNRENVDVKVLKVEKTEETLEPNEVKQTDSALFVGTENGALKLLEIQYPGKRKMKTIDFLRGFKNKFEKVKA